MRVAQLQQSNSDIQRQRLCFHLKWCYGKDNLLQWSQCITSVKTKQTKKTVFTQIVRGGLLNLSFHRILFRDHQNSAACLEKQQLCFLDEPQGMTTSYHFLPSCRFPANHSLKCYAILLFRKQYVDLDFIEYRHHFIPFY